MIEDCFKAVCQTYMLIYLWCHLVETVDKPSAVVCKPGN